MESTLNKYWQNFLTLKKLDKTTPYGGECTFGIDKESSKYLMSLVISGKKRAIFNALESFEIDMEPLPVVGTFYILTDYDDNPCGIIQTQKVEIIPFKDITWKYAQLEGEDENLNEWKLSHQEFFEEDADITGYEFSENSPIVFEEFSLLYKSV